MGGLSSGPGPGICFLTLIVLLVAQQARSAPVQDDSLSTQSRAGYYDGSSSELSSGCYYNFQHYGEGDRIITNEPCLNCTCHNRMLMCYLRVCPFTKAIGQNCTIEKQPGQCCPLIICPEVPVQLLTSSTTEHSEQPHRNQLGGFGYGYGQYGTAVGHLDDFGCRINGEFYTNGAQIPGNIDKPCEVCYCIRNRTACIMQECTLQVEGCIPVYEEGLCCPVRYQCDYEYTYNAITTEQPRPTPGLVLTTTTSGPFECQHDNKWYADGSSVDTEDPCEHCYCMKGDIVCAVQECKTPFEKDGHNCTAMPPAPGKCCPDSYHCDGNEIVDESEPTFRQDRMNKFGRNNANITMSITSSTSSDNQHGWHYGQGTPSNETPNRFTEEHEKDGTAKPGSGKPGSDAEGEMMVTEGLVPSSGTLESASHHIDGHGSAGGMRPVEGHFGMRPMDHGEKPTSQGHGVSTDNLMTISQVIHSIVQNQTNLLKLNQSMMEAGKKPEDDDKIHFPVEHAQTDEDGNPVDSHTGTTEFPDEYYGVTGGHPDLYGQHGGRPQKRPTKPATGQIYGEHGHGGRPQRPGIHKKPEGATGDYEGVTGMPESDKDHTYYDEHGKPHRRPVRPGTEGEGMTEEYEGVTGQPDGDNLYQIYYDKDGKPHRRPVRPGMATGEGVTGEYEGVTGAPEGIYYDKYGKPHRKPVRPGTEDEGMTEDYEGVTGQPDSDNLYQIYYDKDGKPHRRPIRPGMAGETATEGVSGKPDQIYYDKYGKPHRRPVRPGMGAGESEGVTGAPEGIYYDKYGKPHRKPVRPATEDEGMTEEYEGVTGQPDGDKVYQIYYDKDGKPHRRPVRPGMGAGEGVTGEYEGVTGAPQGIYYDKYGKPHRKPVRPGMEGEGVTEEYEGVTGQPDGDKVYQTYYDKDGKPHRRPIRPGMTDEEGTTGEYEGVTRQPGTDNVQTHFDGSQKRPVRPGMAGVGATGKPDSDQAYQIFYDAQGKPHRRPVRPGSGVMTDEGEMSGVTGMPEGFTGRPGSDDDLAIYGEQGHTGRPHKRPGVTGDEGVTESPEGFTGKPGMDTIYDEHGVPVRRPGVMTHEDGNPIEGVTEAGEGYTGQPGQHTIYGEHGRPQKRPTVHKKPGMTGEQTPEGMTETPEDHTAGPDGTYIYYDENGRPHTRPVTHKPGVMTDEVSSGMEGVTETAEAVSGKPDADGMLIFYDEHGRPHKRPIHKQPGSDEAGESVEKVTGSPEDQTGMPETGATEIFYDKFGRPHRRPVTHAEPGEGSTDKPDSDDQQVTYDQHGRPIKRPVVHGQDFPEHGESDGIYGEHGRPHGKPITRPGPQGVPVDEMEEYGTTETPEGQTDNQELFGEHGRPHKRPVVHKRPGSDGTEVYGESTETPEEYTGKPGTHDEPAIFGEHGHTGRPQKRPVSQKPGSPVTTDEHGRPVESDETETQTRLPEVDDHVGETTDEHEKPGQAEKDKPEEVEYQIVYDAYGRPHKRPVVHKHPGSQVPTDEEGNPIEIVTGSPENHLVDEHGRPIEGDKDKPEDVIYQIVYDQFGRPHKRPVVHGKPGQTPMTDEQGKPLEGVVPEDHTGVPEVDEHGHPVKASHKPTMEDGQEPTTGVPETDEHGHPIRKPGQTKPEDESSTEHPMTGESDKPEDQVYQIVYDQYGRPHKRPVVHGKPGETPMTDEHGKPLEGVLPEDHTGAPEVDEHGHPVKSSHKPTDEYGQPLEEMMTESPEGVTGLPGSDDEHGHTGRPHKRPVTHRPGYPTSTDEYGKPVESDTPEEHAAVDEHGHPVVQKGPEGEAVTDSEEHPMTESPEGHVEKPESDSMLGIFGEHGRPHTRPLRPGSGATTELPEEGQTRVPGAALFDEHGLPIKRPVDHKKPEGAGVRPDSVHEDGHPGTEEPYEKPEDLPGSPAHDGSMKPVGQKKPGEGSDMEPETTESPEGSTDHAIFGESGRPHKKPTVQKHPGTPSESSSTETPEITFDEHGQPVKKPSLTEEDGATALPEDHTGKPEMDETEIFYDKYGRPHRRPVTHKKPVESDTSEDHTGVPETDEHGQPVTHRPGEDVTAEDADGKPMDGHKPEGVVYEIVYDQHGRPHRRPVVHGKPQEPTMTDEHEGTGTESPEEQTDRPSGYDETATEHKKPDVSDGEHDQTEEHPVKPDTSYDEHGRPITRPETDHHGKPVTGHDDEKEKPVVTDEDMKPIEGVTGSPEYSPEVTEGEQIYYDEHGRPHRRPVVQKHPGTPMMTDEEGKPIEGVTGSPDDQTTDEHGRPVHRPAVHHGPDDETMTDEHGTPTEGDMEEHTGRPEDVVYQIVYDQFGRPHKRPVVHGKPGETPMTDEYGKPLEGVLPEDHTDVHEVDEHGHPVKASHKPTAEDGEEPTTGVPETDEHGHPIRKPGQTKPEDESSTEHPMTGESDKPEDQVYEIVYDQHGRPHKRPVVHGKPGETPMTDEHGKPLEGVVPEDHTGAPEVDEHGHPVKASQKPSMEDGEEPSTDMPETDEHGHPIRKPGQTKPEDETATEHPTTGESDKPEDVVYQIVYDQFGRPHKRPVVHGKPGETPMTDEHGKPLEGVLPEDHTGVPEVDEHGHPVKASHKPTMEEGEEPTTGVPETDEHGHPIRKPGQTKPEDESTTMHPMTGESVKPEDQVYEIVYDQHGRPHKRPVVHGKPGQTPMTDEHGKPVEGVTSEDHTGAPEVDEDGHPVSGSERPTMEDGEEPSTGAPETDEHGHPIRKPGQTKPEDETATEHPTTGESDKPEDVVYQIVYDQHGRPHKRPVVHGKPGETPMTDEHGKPLEGVVPEDHTGVPEVDEHGHPVKASHKPTMEDGEEPTTGVPETDEHGHPIRRPGQTKPGDESATGDPMTEESDKPEDQVYEIVYDQHGRPHKRPVVHGKPGETPMTDEHGHPVSVPHKPADDGMDHTEMPEVDESGHPVKAGEPEKQQPTGQHKPEDTMTESPMGETKKPGSGAHPTTQDEHGKPVEEDAVLTDDGSHPGEGVTSVPGSVGEHGRPETHGHPEMDETLEDSKPVAGQKPVATDEDGHPLGGMTESPEETGKPADEHTVYDEHGRPVVHKKPGDKPMTGVQETPAEGMMGTPEKPTGTPDDEEVYGHQGFTGQPGMKPQFTTLGPVGIKVTTDEEGNVIGVEEHTDRPEHLDGNVQGTTELPEGYTGSPGTGDEPVIFGEHGHTGRPHKRPVTHRPGYPTSADELGKPVEGAAPEDDTSETEVDEHGHPKKPSHKPTMEDGQEPTTGVPETDEHGHPIRKPGQTKPEDEASTEHPMTGESDKPEDQVYQIVYDKYGRPHKRPVVHGKPGETPMTDEHGKPMEAATPESHTDVPEVDEHGQPVKTSHRPTGEKPEVPETDEHGHPVRKPDQPVTGEHEPELEGHEMTEPTMGQSQKPESDSHQIDHHEQPGVEQQPEGAMTDEHGKPVEGQSPEGVEHDGQSTDRPHPDESGKPMEGASPEDHGAVTEGVDHGHPEQTTDGQKQPGTEKDKPEQIEYEIVYDPYGRPHKRPVVHKHPGSQVLTDDEGNPIDIVTGSPDTHTTDEYGHPVHTPEHHKPDDETTTDEHGVPTEADTEEHTGKPEEVFEIVYDQHGRPHKRPVVHGKPGETPMTDEHGKPLEGVVPEDHTGVPEVDEHGHPVKASHKPTMEDGQEPTTGVSETDEHGQPIRKPGQTKPEDESSTEHPMTGESDKPEDQVFEIVYDQYGRPHKRPVVHGKPGETPMTDEHGKPVEGVTSEDHTGAPEVDEHGHPVSESERPTMEDVEHSTGVPETDEQGHPIRKPGQTKPEDETATEHPMTGESDKPEDVVYEIVYDQFGRPHKRPVVHGKPGETPMTDEQGKPLEGVVPEDHTGAPEVDEHGHPVKASHKPASEDGEEPTTGVPETDEHGHPIRKPGQTKPEDESSTEHPMTGESDKPEDQVYQIVYDQYGRPHKRPVVHGKPGETPMTDEHGKPLEGVLPEDHTGAPEVDEHGHPVKSSHKPTDEYGQPLEEMMTESPEGVTGMPGSDDEHGHTGRPQKRPVTHRPGYPTSTDDYGKPVESDTPEEHAAVDEHGHPVKTSQKPTGEHPGMPETDEDGQPITESPEVTDEHGHPVSQKTPGAEGMPDEEKPTVPEESPMEHSEKPGTDADKPGSTEGHTGRPESDDLGIFGESGRPHKRPQKPVAQDADEHGADRPTLHEGTESDHGVTESPEGDSTVPGKRPGTHEEDGYSTERPGVHPGQKPESDGHPESPAGSEGKPGVETHYDESEPHKKPTPTEAENEVSEDVQPTEEPAIFGEHGHGGRPQKRPVSKPGEAGEGHGPEELPEGSTTRPGVHYDEDGKPKPETDGEVPAGLTEPTLYDEHGRPQKRPGVMVDESQSATGRPEDDTYGKPEHTERPDQHTRPEENEISTSDRVPAAGKPSEQEKKPDADHAGHPESDSVAPGGVSQYLPPKAPEDGSDDQHPGVKPSVATSPDDEDDESLLVTTDESEEEEHPDVHHDKKPEGVTGHEDDMPQVHDGMTHSPKPEDLVTSGVEAGKPAVPVPEPTPGLGYPTQDSTTSGYDAHEVSGVPVTGMPHVTTGHDGKPAVDDSTSDHTPEGVTRVPGMNIVFDEDGKPHLVPVSGTTSSHDEVTSPGYHDVTGKPEDGAPEGVTKTPGIVYDADGKPHVVQDTKPHPMVPGSSDEHKPTEGTHIVFDKDGKPHVVSGSTPGDRQPTEDGKKPEDEAHTPIMVDGMPDSSTLSPFDEVLNNLANVLRPSQSTTAEPTGTTEAHAEVPGEGSCYMDGVVYENNADVPPLSPCHTKCSCINSIIHCLSLKCPTPPEDVSQCTATHDENSCCPTYICGNDVYTTVPVEGEPTTTPASIHDGADLITPIKPVRGSSTHKPETDDKHHGEKPSEHIRPEDSMGSTPSTTDDAQKPQTVHAGPEDAVTGEPSGMHEPTEDGQHPTLGVHLGHPDHRPIESDKPAHVAPPRPSGYFPVSSDDQHPSTSLPSYFGTRKPILSVDQKPGTDDLVHGTDEPEKEHDSTHKPMDEVIQPTGAKPESDDHHKPEDELVVPTTYRPAYQGTKKPVTGGSTPDHKEPETGDDSTQSPTETKKPSEMAEPDEAEESDKPTRPGADTMKPQEQEDVQKRPDGSVVHGKPEEPQQPTSHDQHGMGTERPQETPEEEHGMQTPHEHTDKPGYMKPEVESEGRPTTTRPATDSEKPAEEQDLHRPGSTMVDQPEGETGEKKPEDHVGGVKHPEQEESSTEKFHPKPEDTSAAGEEPGYQSTSKPEEGVMPEGIQKKPQEGSEAVEDGHPSTEPSESDEQTPHGVHPTSMDGESAPTQDGSRPVTQGTTPHGEETDEHVRPQTGADETTMDKESATSGRPQKPGDHPQVGEEQPSHSTPETVSVHGKPEDSTTYRPEGTTSGMHGITSPKPQTEEAVPIEALLHPTRMPGTYETQRPEMEPVNEFDEDVYHKPDTADEIMATIFPDFIRPITKRPTRPGSQGEKLPTKPEDSHKPEEGMGKPDQELTTQLPIDLSEIFTLRPFSTHKPDQHRPDFGDFQPGTMIFQKPEGTMPHGQVPVTTPHGVFAPDSTTETPGQVPEKVKPEDVDHIQYVPVKGDEVPEVPEGATLGEPVTKPDGQKYWPLIFLKKTTTTPKPFRPVPQQVFNGTHFIQYVPYGTGEEPEVPEGATLGQPQKGPDGEVYWPIIDTKPVTSMPEFGGTTPDPYQAGQVYNGTHFIQFVPYKEGEQPEVPEEATLGEPETAADGQKYWPIISTKPIPEEETTTTTPVSQPEQIFNGTHFIQYVPFNNGEEPEIPEDAVLGQPQKGPDGQIYWPVINSKPITETATQKPVQPAQIFNGTNFIQYVPFKDGEAPEVPEGATLGQPQRTPDGQIYWPIIYMKPQPVTPPTGQGQVYNGTNFIQYVPYKEGEKPEVPEEATLGEPQKAPDGQMFWPIIYMKPVSKPVTEAPSQAQIFNGTHFIQYVPFTEGFEPELPEGATLGKPEKRPDGQLYWPVIYEKLPSTPKPDQVQRYPGQAFNGTHFIQYVPYRPSQTPQVPEGVVLGQPEKGPDGNLYWVIVSDKPLPNLQPTTPVEPQVFNGTHYIQYVPYKEGEKPIIPEGAVLGKPESGPAGQRYWPIIYMKPLPGVPITHQRPETSAFDPNVAQVFNGTHYIQYLPYTPGQKPVVPEGATLGHPTRGPNNQMYWPIIYLRPAPGMPVGTQHKPIAHDELFPTDGQVFNGTHYIQYVPYRPNQKPVVPQDATLGHPTRGPNDQLYWPIIYLRPLPGVPITYQRPSGFDPSKAQVFNGTHYIQYVPYVPGQRPVVPEEATLGHLTKGPNNQMYWPIIYLKPAPGIPIATEQEDLPDPTKGQTFNGTHYIQYVPYVPGQRPQVPEGATLGHPTRGPNAQMYWPIIYLRPVPGVPIVQQTFPAAHDSSKPEQVYNGTHFILYVPYNPTQMPEVPEGATLGHPQKGPGGQLYWVIISDKPIPPQGFNGTHFVQYVTPVTPEQDKPEETDHKPIQVFNGTHYIQYVPYKPGQKPVVPEGATLGQPTKGPEGQMYWPIIYMKPRPAAPGSTFLVPGHDRPIPQNGQVFNGTHFIRYVPYKPTKRPQVPEGAVLIEPQKGPDGQLYWMIVSRKPLPAVEEEPFPPSTGQIFNGTHYIQYVPYNASQMPKVPEGAVLGHPQPGPEGQLYWVIISDKPLPAQPGTQYVQYVTPASPESSPEDQVPGPMFNGTHYIHYVPYKPGQVPKVQDGGVLGELQKGPGGMYWPIIYRRPPQEPVRANATSTADDHPFWSYGQYGSGNATVPEDGLWSQKPQNDSDSNKGGAKLPTSQYGGAKPGHKQPEKPRPPEDVSYETIDEDHLIEYPSGSDYDETQEQPYGPGTCRYAGKVYVSAQQIPRDDPCDFCFCFRSDIICLQQSCPPPIPGCHEEPIQGFCCPRYECHVRMATLLNVTSTTTTTTTTLPPHFLSHVYKGAAGRTGCFVQGKAYRVGQAIPSASGPCMDCICGGDGKMKCEPKVCTPEPMVRQMMVSEKPTTASHR